MTHVDIELHWRPAFPFPLEQEAPGDLHPQHLLQADSLRAELDAVRVVRLRLAPLVFHRDHRLVRMKLHDVALPRETESARDHGQGPRYADAGARLAEAVVGLLVQDITLRRKTVGWAQSLPKSSRTPWVTAFHLPRLWNGRRISPSRPQAQNCLAPTRPSSRLNPPISFLVMPALVSLSARIGNGNTRPVLFPTAPISVDFAPTPAGSLAAPVGQKRSNRPPFFRLPTLSRMDNCF